MRCAPRSRVRHTTWDARVNRGSYNCPKVNSKRLLKGIKEISREDLGTLSQQVRSTASTVSRFCLFHHMTVVGGRSRSPSRQAQGRKENSKPTESYLLTQALSLKTPPRLVGNSHAGSER